MRVVNGELVGVVTLRPGRGVMPNGGGCTILVS